MSDNSTIIKSTRNLGSVKSVIRSAYALPSDECFVTRLSYVILEWRAQHPEIRFLDWPDYVSDINPIKEVFTVVSDTLDNDPEYPGDFCEAWLHVKEDYDDHRHLHNDLKRIIGQVVQIKEEYKLSENTLFIYRFHKETIRTRQPSDFFWITIRRIHLTTPETGSPITLLNAPANSPDLYPIENFLSETTRDWVNVFPRNRTTLEPVIVQKWESFRGHPTYFTNIYDSMPFRMQAVINNNSGPTCY